MKKPLPGQDGERLDSEAPLPESKNTPSCSHFEISDLEIVDHRTVKATFSLTLPGVTLRKCRMHCVRGESFVRGPGMRAGWAPGGWEEHAELDDALANGVLEVVLARLSEAHAD